VPTSRHTERTRRRPPNDEPSPQAHHERPSEIQPQGGPFQNGPTSDPTEAQANQMTLSLREAIIMVKSGQEPEEKRHLPVVGKPPKAKPVKRPPSTKKPKPKAAKNTHAHGEYRNYFIGGCRCNLCRSAATTYSKAKRHERYNTPTEQIPHGTKNGYANFGCRCTPCLGAMKQYQRRYPESPEAKARRAERKRANRAKKRALQG